MLLCSLSAAVRPRRAYMAALHRTSLFLIKVVGGSTSNENFYYYFLKAGSNVEAGRHALEK